MFDTFKRSTAQADVDLVDLNLIQERLAETLVDAGMAPESKVFLALHKMLCDDVIWYFEQITAPELESVNKD